MTELRLALVFGTRPEIIKLAPVMEACAQRGIEFTTIHTGQHYSENLTDVFFERLGLPSPDFNLDVGSGPHGAQTGSILTRVEDVLLEERPDVVLVQGDTNSVLAGSIATSKLPMELGHVEAGLRSFDRNMPEEINRTLSDHASDYLFAPTQNAADQLRTEGIPRDRIHVTGNTIVDAVYAFRGVAEEESAVLDDLGLSPGEFVLMTAHRAENVDDPDRFGGMLAAAQQVGRDLGVPVIYPIHPRSRRRLDEFDVTVSDPVRLLDPVDFLSFIRLESTARLILTDSGGIQEEACILQTPCVTMRDSTERPETVDVGANEVAGTRRQDIVDATDRMASVEPDWSNPFGDGTAAEQILDHLSAQISRGS